MKVGFELGGVEDLSRTPLTVVLHGRNDPVVSAVDVDDFFDHVFRLRFNVECLKRNVVAAEKLHCLVTMRTDVPVIDFQHDSPLMVNGW